MAAVSFFLGLAVYFGLTWIPQILVDAGFSRTTAGMFSMISGASGIVGGLAVGWLASKWGPVRVVSLIMVGFGLSLAVFGIVPAQLRLMAGVVAITGFCLFGSAAGLYAALAQHFSDEARAAGCGLAIGVARIASVIAPLLSGWMFASGLSRAEICVAWGLSAVAAGAILGGPLLGTRIRARFPDSALPRGLN